MFRGQLGVLGGIPAGVMCLKSITPTARISVCVCVCVCVSPKDVITMVIQKPVDYVVEKNRVDLYSAFGEIYIYSIHTQYLAQIVLLFFYVLYPTTVDYIIVLLYIYIGC